MGVCEICRFKRFHNENVKTQADDSPSAATAAG